MYVRTDHQYKQLFALKGVPLTQGPEAVSIVAHQWEYIVRAMQSLYIPLPPAVRNCQIG